MDVRINSEIKFTLSMPSEGESPCVVSYTNPLTGVENKVIFLPTDNPVEEGLLTMCHHLINTYEKT